MRGGLNSDQNVESILMAGVPLEWIRRRKVLFICNYKDSPIRLAIDQKSMELIQQLLPYYI